MSEHSDRERFFGKDAPTPRPSEGLDWARLFHDTYERLAPSFGYETRKDTKTFDPESPNGKLMVAVCGAVVARARAETLQEAIDGIRKEIVAFAATFPELKDGPQLWGKELACRYLERMLEASR